MWFGLWLGFGLGSGSRGECLRVGGWVVLGDKGVGWAKSVSLGRGSGKWRVRVV